MQELWQYTIEPLQISQCVICIGKDKYIRGTKETMQTIWIKLKKCEKLYAKVNIISVGNHLVIE